MQSSHYEEKLPGAASLGGLAIETKGHRGAGQFPHARRGSISRLNVDDDLPEGPSLD